MLYLPGAIYSLTGAASFRGFSWRKLGVDSGPEEIRAWACLGPVFLALVHILSSPSNRQLLSLLSLTSSGKIVPAKPDWLSFWGASANQRQDVVKIVLWPYHHLRKPIWVGFFVVVVVVFLFLFWFLFGDFPKVPSYLRSPYEHLQAELSGPLKSRSGHPTGINAPYLFSWRGCGTLYLVTFWR